MLAFVLDAVGQAPHLADFRDPTASDGTVGRVIAGGLNPMDRLMAFGLTESLMGPLPTPIVLGVEGVFELDGQRVYAETATPFGSLAEYAIVDPNTVHPLPEDVAAEHAIALGNAGLAGWLALDHKAELQPGETVIVLGATGASGQVAVQAAHLLGAGKVVAAGRNVEVLQQLLGKGADEIVVLGSDDDTAALKEATGGGADVVFDPLYGPPLVAALGATKFGGRAVSIGMSAGQPAQLTIFDVFGKSLLMHGNAMVPPDVLGQAYDTLLDHLIAGRLTVSTEVLALDDAPQAWERLGQSPHCKLVLTPPGS